MKTLNDDVQMRSDWSLPICTGGERLKDEGGSKLHPTQKPESLLHRVLLASTQAGDVVLDPFFGTGTTGAVAKKLGRHFIGIEAEADYAEAAMQRIGRVEKLSDEELELTQSPKAQPRVAFGTLVERGLVKPGMQLFGPARKAQGKVAPKCAPTARLSWGVRKTRLQAAFIKWAQPRKARQAAMAGPSGTIKTAKNLCRLTICGRKSGMKGRGFSA